MGLQAPERQRRDVRRHLFWPQKLQVWGCYRRKDLEVRLSTRKDIPAVTQTEGRMKGLGGLTSPQQVTHHGPGAPLRDFRRRQVAGRDDLPPRESTTSSLQTDQISSDDAATTASPVQATSARQVCGSSRSLLGAMKGSEPSPDAGTEDRGQRGQNTGAGSFYTASRVTMELSCPS